MTEDRTKYKAEKMSGTGKRITEIFAFIAEESPGDEGIMGIEAEGPTGPWMLQMVTTEKRLLKKLLPQAIAIERATGRSWKIVRFKIDRVVEDDG